MAGPPAALVRTLIEGPSPVRALEWHDAIDSTNRRALQLAAEGAPELHVVAADVQTAGRGRAGRSWTAPPGSSLMLSLVVRPPVAPAALGLLPLLTGLVLAETVERFLPAADVGLKWPNDLLIRRDAGTAWRKGAGILVEATADAAVVGVGVNVDWRATDRPAELAEVATSLAEVAGGDVDRWRLLAAFLGVFGNRYAAWCELPAAFLDGYRQRCVTLGQQVRAEGPGGRVLQGWATGLAASGALVVRTADDRTLEVAAGDVTHLRPV
jgi:BirA family transcriptional regulator, biotin operon repressor / biotin---[acetyl-CoA-carboxylase] ligase